MTAAGRRPASRARVFVALTLLGTAVFAAVVYEILPVGLLTPIAADLGVSEQDAGFLISAFSIIVVVGSIPLSALTARYGARMTLAVVLATFCVSAAIMASSTSLPTAVIARAIGGLGHAVLFTAVYRIALSIVPTHRQAIAATTVSAGNAIAFALGVPLATALGSLGSWRTPFWVIAIGFAVLLCTVLLVLPKADLADERRFTTREVLRAAVQPRLLRVALTIIVILTAQFLTYTYVEPMILAAGVPAGNVGLVLLAYGAASVVGLVSVSRLAQAHPAAALRVALVVILASLVFVWFAGQSAVLMTVAVVIWGFGFGTLPVLLQVLALRASPTLPEASAPVSNTAFNIGITLGALVGGGVIAAGGVGPLSLVSAGVLAVIAIVAMLPHWLPADGRVRS